MVYGGGPPAPIIDGYEVYSEDGTLLGSVKEVVGDRFRVESNSGPDYWIIDTVVADVANRRVTLSIIESQLDGYKVGPPT